jgi:hypothetical protein
MKKDLAVICDSILCFIVLCAAFAVVAFSELFGRRPTTKSSESLGHR